MRPYTYEHIFPAKSIRQRFSGKFTYYNILSALLPDKGTHEMLFLYIH